MTVQVSNSAGDVCSVPLEVTVTESITYVVFDKANQVGTLERTIQYKDYTPPKIHLKEPLRYSTTEVGKANLTENMKAEDCLDGDLTSQIRTSLDDGMYNAAAGIR